MGQLGSVSVYVIARIALAIIGRSSLLKPGLPYNFGNKIRVMTDRIFKLIHIVNSLHFPMIER
jgi:hypothetical protein